MMFIAVSAGEVIFAMASIISSWKMSVPLALGSSRRPPVPRPPSVSGEAGHGGWEMQLLPHLKIPEKVGEERTGPTMLRRHNTVYGRM